MKSQINNFNNNSISSSSFFSKENIGNIANTMSVLLAAAIFSIPWSFYEAGIIGGIFIIIIASIISSTTILILLQAQRNLYQQTGIVFDYPQLTSEYLGSENWALSIQIATTISCLGGCAGFFVFIGQICAQQLELPLTQTIILLCIPMILLSWIRSFRELSIFTIFGVGSIVISVIAIFIEGFPIQTDKLVIQLFDPIESLGFLGNATFLFTVHYCILSMGAEVLRHYHIKKTTSHLNQNNLNYIESSYQNSNSDDHHSITNSLNENNQHIPDTLTVPVIVAFIFGTIVVGSLGLVGPFIYSGTPLVRDQTGHIIEGCEDIVCQNIVLNLPEGTLRSIVGIILIISIMITYMLLLAPAREHIEKYILDIIQPSSNLSAEWIRNLVRSLLVIGTASIALQAPYFGSVLRTVGGLTDAYQSYIIPPLIAFQLYSPRFNIDDNNNNGVESNSNSSHNNNNNNSHSHSNNNNGNRNENHSNSILYYRIVFIWGICLMGFTFYQTILSVLKYPK